MPLTNTNPAYVVAKTKEIKVNCCYFLKKRKWLFEINSLWKLKNN